jgi:predicted RNase H-like HicB family nuclease
MVTKRMPKKTPTYSMRVFWSEEDGGFIAVCPELKRVSAFGETYSDAIEELQVAIAGAVEMYAREGWPLPEPMIESDRSGQTRVRMPRSLHAHLVADAEREGVSLNTLIVSRLGESTGGDAAARAVVKQLRAEMNHSRPARTAVPAAPRVARRRVASRSKPRQIE